MKYKAELRIPTDQYAYINVDIEGEPDEIVQAYREFSDLVRPKLGLETKDFNRALDEYLTTNKFKNPEETYFKMNPEQQKIIQEIKKSVKRLEKTEN